MNEQPVQNAAIVKFVAGIIATGLLITPLTRSGEATPNGAGSTLADFRTALTTIQSTRSSWLAILSGPTLATFPTNFDTDNLHLTTTGQSQKESNIRTTVGY